jgi:hypothetical protein
MAGEYEEPDYRSIDQVLTEWATKQGRHFDTDYKGYVVRSIWKEPIQLWIDAPDGEGYVKVHVAERRLELLSKWGRKLEWRTTQSELSNCLDQAWKIGTAWS